MSGPLDLQPWATDVPSAVIDAIGGARRVLAVSHENPDADTLGASIAVGLIVGAHGGRTTLVCSDPPPPAYDFLPGTAGFRTDPEPGVAYDLLVVSDCGSLDRIGEVGRRCHSRCGGR